MPGFTKHILFCLVLTLPPSGRAAPASPAAGCPVPGFPTAASFTTGTNPRAVAVADFNGDGKADAATANQSSNNVSVFLGTGGGGFAPPVNYASVPQPFQMAAADFNGDGRADLAVAGFTNQGVTLLVNDGAGGFAGTIVSTGNNTPAGLAAADFNGDGKIDLVISGTDIRVRVMLNAGGGAFNAPVTTFVTSDVSRLAAADVNNDGKQDLVALDPGFNSSSRRLLVLRGDGAGGFGAPAFHELGRVPGSLALGDVDSDLDLDIVVTTDQDVKLLRGDGGGNFATAATIAAGPSPRAALVKDFDGDGRADLALAFGGASQGEGGSAGVMLGAGGGNFGPLTHYVVGTGPFALASSDFNSDGKFDLAVVNYGNNTGTPGGLAVLLGEGGGTFAAPASFVIGPGPDDLLVADFNGDGKLDLAAPRQLPGGVGIILGDGSARFGPPTNFAFTGFPDGAAAGDLNGDGRADVVVTTQSPDALYVFLGDGAGGLGGPTTFAAGATPYGIAIDDYNGDGKRDLAVANPGSNTVSILLGNGAGGFGAAASFAVGNAPISVAAGDFNSDGKRDLAVANSGSGSRVSILLGAGDGGFTAAPNAAARTTPQHVAVADFNSDGKQDLAVANRVSGDVSILLGGGDGSFSAPTHFATGGNPFHVAAGDINGDGIIDLAVPVYSQPRVAVLLGAGAGAFGEPFYFPTGQGPQTVVIADLNGDGANDLAVNNRTADSVTVLRNACATTTDQPSVRFNASASAVGEGAGVVNISVNRSGSTAGAVSVNYATAGGTATAGADYTAVSGTLTFAPGEAVKSFAVPVLEDAAVEGGETVLVQLGNPTGGATLGTPSTAEITINDNDSCSYGVSPASLPQFAAGGGVGSLQIIIPVGCAWSSTSGENWIRPTAVWAGRGPGTITFNVLPNPGAARAGGITLTDGTRYQITQAGGAPVVQFSHGGYAVNEGDGRAVVQVGRLGDTAAALTVSVQTVDDPAEVRCDVAGGVAYARCDYATTVETVTFAAGDAQPKTVTVPLIDDGHGDGFETFQVRLAGPSGGFLLNQSTVTVTVSDNDSSAGGPNPVNGNAFFVRQHYLDFLSREPEAGEPWTGVLDRCPNVNGDPTCDRNLVSGAFFQSPEFQLKGYYAYLFYKAGLGRRPAYAEIIPDMRSVTGQTGGEVFAKRAAFAAAFAARPEFKELYDPLTDAQYVDALLGRYGAQRITTEDPRQPEESAQVTLTRQQLIDALGADTLTRAQVLRAVVQSAEADAAEYHGAFVAMQYYGYLRRAPEASGYEAWLRVIRQDPNNVRVMIDGFMNSQEYRLRFGQP